MQLISSLMSYLMLPIVRLTLGCQSVIGDLAGWLALA